MDPKNRPAKTIFLKELHAMCQAQIVFAIKPFRQLHAAEMD